MNEPTRLPVLDALAAVVDRAALAAPVELDAYRAALVRLARHHEALTPAQRVVVDADLARSPRAA